MTPSSLWFAFALFAAEEVPTPAVPARYRVVPDFDADVWQVTATFPRREAGDLDFRFPRWTAGAYHLSEYGRFVTELTAADAAGAPLPVERDGDSRFVVAAGDAGPVTLAWTARECAPGDTNEGMILDVEGNRLSADYGFLNPNSLLGFVKGDVDRPCEVELV